MKLIIGLLSILLTTQFAFAKAKAVKHAHNGRYHTHVLPKKEGLGHNHNRAKYNNHSSKKLINNQRKANVGNKWRSFKGCKYLFPTALIQNRAIFKSPLKNQDIIKITNIDETGKTFTHCENGYITGYHYIHFRITPSYFKKLGISQDYIGTLESPIRLIISGRMDKGIYNENLNFTIYRITKKRSGYILYDHGKKSKKYLVAMLKSDFLKTHPTQEWYAIIEGMFADGKGNYYTSKKDLVDATLNTSNPLKHSLDVNVKLIGGKNQKISFDDSLLTSKVQKLKKSLYVSYLVNSNDKQSMNGKSYKVKLVLDINLKYVISSNLKVLGISPTSTKTQQVYKEIDIILTPENSWKYSGKELLINVTTSTIGKAVGFRVAKSFIGLEKKIYIKSIKEL